MVVIHVPFAFLLGYRQLKLIPSYPAFPRLQLCFLIYFDEKIGSARCLLVVTWVFKFFSLSDKLLEKMIKL